MSFYPSAPRGASLPVFSLLFSFFFVIFVLHKLLYSRFYSACFVLRNLNPRNLMIEVSVSGEILIQRLERIE